MGKPPSEDREPSSDQFTGVQHLLAQHAPPYVDFSVFGPHSIRLRKKMRLGGCFLASDGSLQKCELFGPTNFEDWSKSYKVLSTILIMLDAVFPEELDGYHDLIKEYHCRYGFRCWPTIYQADVRCRQERMQSLRRRGVSLHNADPAAAGRAGFAVDKPWRYVWSEAVSDANFWLKEVQEKCLLILTKVTSAEAGLDGDVQVASGSGSLPSQMSGGQQRERSPRRQDTAKPPRKQVGDNRQHNVDQDGIMKTNRAGRELCRLFQKGECGKAYGAMGTCPRDRNNVHQCAKCLSQDHGAHHPVECTAAARTAPTPRKGGKKGRGKGGKY